MVLVDGIFISGYGVKCDEFLVIGELDFLKKVLGEEVYRIFEVILRGEEVLYDIEKFDLFIIFGSKVNEGIGIFLVIVVGVNFCYGCIMMFLYIEIEDMFL